MNIVAIDVSKDKLDIFFNFDKSFKSIQNNTKDILLLIKYIKKLENICVVFEFTGGYEKLLRNLLLESQIPISICSGRKIRDFARSQGLLAKTDKLDAKIIAKYAQVSDLVIISEIDKKAEYLRDLNTRRKQIINLINEEQNKLEHKHHKVIEKTIKMSLKALEKGLHMIENEIEELIKTNKMLSEKKEILESIPGIGSISALTLIAELPELGSLSKSKIAALSGLAPMNRDSGKYLGYRKVGHSRASIKSVLYMAAMSAIKCNIRIKEFYLKLRSKGKPGKVALVACMRKLIIFMNAMLQKKAFWQTT